MKDQLRGQPITKVEVISDTSLTETDDGRPVQLGQEYSFDSPPTDGRPILSISDDLDDDQIAMPIALVDDNSLFGADGRPVYAVMGFDANGAASPIGTSYAAYAFAADFDDQEYWSGGTQYGATDNPIFDHTFTSGTEGWTAGLNGTVVATGGELVITSTGGDQGANLYLPGMIPGARYRLEVDFISSLGQTLVTAGGGNEIYANVNFGQPTAQTYVLDYVGIYVNSNVAITAVGTGNVVKVTGVRLTQLAGPWALPGYTYTRTGEQGAVDSTGAVSYFPANVPAINDRGYHAYGALTNEAKDSQNLAAGSAWELFAGAAFGTSNSGVAPDGTTTADELVFSGTGQIVYQWVSAGAMGQTVTGSIWIRAVSGSPSVRLYILDMANRYSGVITPTGAWQRVALSQTLTSGQATQFAIESSAAGTIEVWQGQIMVGDFPDGGPIIRTAGATASIGASTLTADVAPTDQEQLFFATGTPSDFNSGGLYENVLAHLTDVSTNNSIRLRVTTAGLPSALVVAGGATVYSAAAAGAVSQGAALTIVLLRQGGNWRAGTVIGGVLSWFGAATAGAFPTGITQAMLGHRNGTSHTQGPLAGVFIRPGTYANDAAVLAAVTETA